MRTKVATPRIVYPVSPLPGLLLRTFTALLLFAAGYWIGSGMDLAALQRGELIHPEGVAELRTRAAALEQERDALKARLAEQQRQAPPAEPKN